MLGKARDPEIGDPAGHNAAEMRQVGGNVYGEAMKCDPALHAHSKSSDLGLILTFTDPDSDASRSSMSSEAKLGERVDHPPFQGIHETTDVLPALFEIEHHVANALSWPMVSVAAAAAGFVDRKILRVEELGRIGTGARGEQRWMLEQPDAFSGRSIANRGNALFHEAKCVFVSDGYVAGSPLDALDALHRARHMGAETKRSKRRCAIAGAPA